MPKKVQTVEADSVYFLKVLLYFVLGTIWVRNNGATVFPVGLVVGIIFTSHDHFRIDRKVEYAVLLIAAMMGLFGAGIFINL